MDNFDDILKKFKKLLSEFPGVKAAMIVSTEGLPIVSALPEGIDETKMAAMTAAIFSLAKRSFNEMEKGEFHQLYIKGKEGYLLVLQAGPNAVLTVSVAKGARPGLIFGSFLFPYISQPPPGEAVAEAMLRPECIPPKKGLETTLYCKHCGADLLNGESICHVCGKKTV